MTKLSVAVVFALTVLMYPMASRANCNKIGTIGRFTRRSGAIALTGAFALAVALTVAPGSAVAEECRLDSGSAVGATSGDAETLACGANADAGNIFTTAIGADSIADGQNAVAVGNGADAGGFSATAIGTNANATFANSIAIGVGAVTTRIDQVVVGTASNTYTMPGLTSAASSAAQSGPTEFVTTDAAGNLASDGGAMMAGIGANAQAINENTEGIAIALAAADPDLVGDESFGLRINFGEFSGESAIAFSAMGVVARNVFGSRGRLALAASIGVGLSEGEVGGRVGAQLTW